MSMTFQKRQKELKRQEKSWHYSGDISGDPSPCWLEPICHA